MTVTLPNDTLTIRPACRGDFDRVDCLLAQSYPKLLKQDYAPSIMATALPRIARANMRLLRSGRYFVVEDENGALCGAGGWSRHHPASGRIRPALGHIRHVVTDHRHTRRGVGQSLLRHIFADAAKADVNQFECCSTLTAVPFYASLGFRALGAVEIPLAPGIRFPAVEMQKTLH